MSHHHHHRSNSAREREEQFVGPYKLEKTLGKGQTGKLMHTNSDQCHPIWAEGRENLSLGFATK